MRMGTTNITVARFYGVPSYYSVMPADIFTALENAFIHGERSVPVDRSAFRKMMADYKRKLAYYEKVHQPGCH